MPEIHKVSPSSPDASPDKPSPGLLQRIAQGIQGLFQKQWLEWGMNADKKDEQYIQQCFPNMSPEGMSKELQCYRAIRGRIETESLNQLLAAGQYPSDIKVSLDTIQQIENLPPEYRQRAEANISEKNMNPFMALHEALLQQAFDLLEKPYQQIAEEMAKRQGVMTPEIIVQAKAQQEIDTLPSPEKEIAQWLSKQYFLPTWSLQQLIEYKQTIDELKGEKQDSTFIIEKIIGMIEIKRMIEESIYIDPEKKAELLRYIGQIANIVIKREIIHAENLKRLPPHIAELYLHIKKTLLTSKMTDKKDDQGTKIIAYALAQYITINILDREKRVAVEQHRGKNTNPETCLTALTIVAPEYNCIVGKNREQLLHFSHTLSSPDPAKKEE